MLDLNVVIYTNGSDFKICFGRDVENLIFDQEFVVFEKTVHKSLLFFQDLWIMHQLMISYSFQMVKGRDFLPLILRLFHIR